MNTITFSALLNDAVTQPGKISAAYRAFHNYSFGNMMAAAFQLSMRDMPLSPIASYKAWQGMGRQVKKGAKAIALCMPVTCKGTRENDRGEKEEFTFGRFVWKNNWFALSDTEGQEYAAETVSPAWNAEKALEALEISQVPFEHVNGNAQGYAFARCIAINPVAALPHKTRFHEMAHVVLGHTTEGMMQDSEATPRNIAEVEAEAVAYILCALLDLPGLAESRGYVQGWLAGAEVSERSAQRIYKAADSIYKAGNQG